MNTGDVLYRCVTAVSLVAIFFGAPLAGALLDGQPPSAYLEFPPRTEAGENVPFNWPIFAGFVLFTLVTTWPFWRRMARANQPFSLSLPWRTDRPGSTARSSDQPFTEWSEPNRFPAWGWVGLAGTIIIWLLIWTRIEMLHSLQRLLFFPLWFSFILFLNALCQRVSGRSLMTERPLYFTLLFPISALFWWSFEYLNRFVSNWHYLGIGDLGGGQYFIEATLAFSTVIPAVMSIRFILMQLTIFNSTLQDFPPAPRLLNRSTWAIAGFVSVGGLVVMGLLPDLSYPFTWILPGLIWITYQKANGYDSPLLTRAASGDYTLVWSSACAALVCGFFWEMWNMYSEAKWIYSVPGVDRFHIFEMPVAGYAGYLPFGVICALISNSLLNTLSGSCDEIEENTG